VFADRLGPKFHRTKREWVESTFLCWASVSSKGFQTPADGANNFLKFQNAQLRVFNRNLVVFPAMAVRILSRILPSLSDIAYTNIP
jgi:hypothetical protein